MSKTHRPTNVEVFANRAAQAKAAKHAANGQPGPGNLQASQASLGTLQASQAAQGTSQEPQPTQSPEAKASEQLAVLAHELQQVQQTIHQQKVSYIQSRVNIALEFAKAQVSFGALEESTMSEVFATAFKLSDEFTARARSVEQSLAEECPIDPSLIKHFEGLRERYDTLAHKLSKEEPTPPEAA